MGFAFLPSWHRFLVGWPVWREAYSNISVNNHIILSWTWYAISGVGVVTTLLLWIYDRIVQPGPPPSTANSNA